MKREVTVSITFHSTVVHPGTWNSGKKSPCEPGIQTRQRQREPLSGKRITVDTWTRALQDRGSGRQRCQRRNTGPTPPPPQHTHTHPSETGTYRTARKAERTFSTALPTGNRGGGVEAVQPGFHLLISSSTQWEVFLSNYRSCWKLQGRQDLRPR